MTDNWTPRVDSRVKLADTLLSSHLQRIQAAGLLASDLEEIRDQGLACRQADREQKAELAELLTRQSERRETDSVTFAREDELRDRLPLVARDLERAGNKAQARWLGHVTFARYRLREVTPPPGDALSDAEKAELDKYVRVERADVFSRMNGLDALCEALLAPERAPIVAALNARGFGTEALTAVKNAAAAIAAAGPNHLAAASATQRETAAATAQRKAWSEARRAIRKACAGDDKLERLLASC